MSTISESVFLSTF